MACRLKYEDIHTYSWSVFSLTFLLMNNYAQKLRNRSLVGFSFRSHSLTGTVKGKKALQDLINTLGLPFSSAAQGFFFFWLFFCFPPLFFACGRNGVTRGAKSIWNQMISFHAKVHNTKTSLEIFRKPVHLSAIVRSRYLVGTGTGVGLFSPM